MHRLAGGLVDVDHELERASIYTGIAETKRRQGKAREAESNYEKALALMPGYQPALRRAPPPRPLASGLGPALHDIVTRAVSAANRCLRVARF